MKIAYRLLLVISIGVFYFYSLSGQESSDFLIIGDEDLVEGKLNAKEYLMGWIYDAEADSAGNIYIYDFQTKTLKKFSKAGKFIRQISHQGKGPGEFISISKIESDGVRYLYLDNSGRNILQYDLEGNFIKEIDYMAHCPNMFDFDLFENNRLIMFGFRKEKENWFENNFCSISTETGAVIEFGDLPRREFKKKAMEKSFRRNPRAESRLYVGRIAISSVTLNICYSSWNNPREVLVYSYGQSKPDKTIIDHNFPPGCTENPPHGNSREIKIRDESNTSIKLYSSQTSMDDCYVIGNVFYHLIIDHAKNQILITGTDLSTEKIVFTTQIAGDASGGIPFEFLDLDQNLNAYFSSNDPYPRLVRVKLKNNSTINLQNLK